MKKTRKYISVCLCVVMFASMCLCVGCQKKAETIEKKKKQIELWHYWDIPGNQQHLEELVDQFNQHIDSRKSRALSQYVLSSFEQFCLYGGAAIGIIGLFMFVAGSIFLGAIAVIAGIAMVLNHNSKKKQIEQNKKTAEEQFEKKRETGVQIIRATLAEVVDFRLDFSEHDAESQSVIDFLEQISPDQYVRKLATSNRRIKM